MFAFYLSMVAYAMPLSWVFSENSVVEEETWLGELTYTDVGSLYQQPVQMEPLLPFVAFGMRFDDDLMVGLVDDGEWGMTEVSRVYLPNGDSVWFALDSKLNGEQFVGLSNDPRAAKIAASFPASTYLAGLVVEELNDGSGHTEFHATWTRLDGEPMDLWMRSSDNDQPPRKRNGNGMNHSQGTVLALLDLYSMHLVGGDQLTLNSEHARRVQRVMGIQIAARMRQVVGGLRAGDWVQNGTELTDSVGHTVSFRVVDKDTQMWLESVGQPQELRYQFDKVGDKLQLREIRLFQVAEDRDPELMHMQFNPSLPDLRHGPPTSRWKGRVATTINGRQGWHHGTVTVENVDGNAEITVESLAPSWAASRPVWSRIAFAGAPKLQSRVLAAGGEQSVDMELTLGERLTELRSPAVVDMRWDKRPHRLSDLTVLVDALDAGKDVVKLGGGTWANGKFAADRMEHTVDAVTVVGDALYAVQTSRFPLVPRALLPNERSSSVLGVANVTIPLPSDVVDRQAVVWIRGFSLVPGPGYKDTGITTRGLRVAIAHQRVVGDTLHLVLQMSQELGSVPDRKQNLNQYTALGQIALGVSMSVSESPQKIVVERTKFTHPRRILGRTPPLLLCDDKRSWVPLRSWSFTLANEEKDSGRYLRRLTVDATAEGGLSDFDNVGAWARPVRAEVERTIVYQSGLQWRPDSCASTVSWRSH